jgi:hypothetical protein
MAKRAMLLLLVLAGCARQTTAPPRPGDGPGAVLSADAGGEGDAASTTPGDAAVIVVVDVGADAPVASADAAAPTGDGPVDRGLGIVPDGAPWQMMCAPGASRAECCSLYCACMVKYCPATLPSGCQAACEGGGNWDLVCRTYQCFASQNPSFPQDHDSHCRHAIGQQGRCGNR